jgi:hypothetical protein
VAEVHAELAELARAGPTAAQVTALVQTVRRQTETDMEHNRFWLSAARAAYQSRRYLGDVGATVNEARAISEVRPPRAHRPSETSP